MNLGSFLKMPLLKNGVLFTLFSFLNSGINFFLLLLLAHYFPTDQYGKLNLFNTLLTLITPLISLSTLGYVSVSYFRLSKKDFKSVIQSYFIISSNVFIVLLVIIWVGRLYWEQYIGIDAHFLYIAVIICWAQIFTLLNLELWRLGENPISYGIYTVAITICNFVITLWLVEICDGGWESRIYTLLCVTLVFAFISFIVIYKRGYCTFLIPTKLIFEKTLYFGLPLIPHQLSFWMRQGLDRFIINYFYSQATVGVFSFAYNFANIVIILGAAFNSANSVFIYKTIANGGSDGKRILLRQTKLMACIFGVTTALVILLAYSLCPILFPAYKSSLVYVLPLCVSAFIHCIYLLFVNYLFYFGKTKKLMYITLTFSLIHTLLSLSFTRFSVMATAYIGMFCNLMICVFVVYDSDKTYSIINKNGE